MAEAAGAGEGVVAAERPTETLGTGAGAVSAGGAGFDGCAHPLHARPLSTANFTPRGTIFMVTTIREDPRRMGPAQLQATVTSTVGCSLRARAR